MNRNIRVGENAPLSQQKNFTVLLLLLLLCIVMCVLLAATHREIVRNVLTSDLLFSN